MTSVQSVQVTSFSSLMATIESVTDGWDYTWFRGQRTANCHPKPKIFRGEYLSVKEREALELFQAKASALLSNVDPSDAIQWLCYAQHYRLPTRLLDWTESLLVALYFAFIDGDLDDHDSPCVWVLHPRRLNRLSGINSVPFQGHERVVASAHRAFGSSKTTGLQESEGPFCFYPRAIDPRMLAQGSVFSVHWDGKLGVDEFIEQSNEKPSPDTNILTRITFTTDFTQQIYSTERHLIPRKLQIMPDLSTVCESVREQLWPDAGDTF